MKKFLLFGCALSLFVGCANADLKQIPTADSVLEITERVADWQIRTFEDQGKYRAVPEYKEDDVKRREKYHDLRWMPAVFYAGLYQLYMVDSKESYVEWLDGMGDKYKWRLHDRMYHADDHAVGQFYLNMYDQYRENYMLKPTQKQFDAIMGGDKSDKFHWWWCDALFMAPPVWARMTKVTGDRKYIEYMDSQYHKTYDLLWSEKDSLFFRDKKYISKHEENGESLFWGRGNGWVFGGLTLLIQDLPQDWEERVFYEDLFKKIAHKLKEVQRPDGTWSAGLLGDLDDYPTIETSGSSFYTFGIAWGIRAGLLDRVEYEPTLLKAWGGLTSAVDESGMLGYAQPVGASPDGSASNGSELYAVGAFLSAGAQMYQYINEFYPTLK